MDCLDHQAGGPMSHRTEKISAIAVGFSAAEPSELSMCLVVAAVAGRVVHRGPVREL